MRYDDSEVAAEVEAARHAASKSSICLASGPPPLREVNEGFHVVCVEGSSDDAAWRSLLALYEQAVVGEGSADDAAHREQWTQDLGQRARTAHGGLVLKQREPEAFVSALAWTRRRNQYVVTVAHTVACWRRQQHAEVLWWQLRKQMPPGATCMTHFACALSAQASRFWKRLGFEPSADTARAAAKRGRKSAFEVGDDHLVWVLRLHGNGSARLISRAGGPTRRRPCRRQEHSLFTYIVR